MTIEAKNSIIESEIEPVIVPITYERWQRQKAKLLEMSLADVRNVANEIRGCIPEEALDLIASVVEDFDP